MEDQISNTVCHNLGHKLDCLSSSDSHIFKVPRHLRRFNEKAYEPQIISIGPYHRGKQHLKGMEIHKLHYLKTFLGRNENLPTYVDAMRAMEDKVRKCYKETIDLNAEAFIEMMILDGCFIVELIWRWKEKALREENDELFTVDSIMVKITHDLLLLENQLPFFVLLKLFDMSYKEKIPNHQSQESYFIAMALFFFAPIMPGPGIQYKYKEPPSVQDIQDIKHLLDLVHKSWLPSPQGMKRYGEQQKKWIFKRSASELRKAGVKFEKITVDSKFKRLFDKMLEWLFCGDSLVDKMSENRGVEVEGDSLVDKMLKNEGVKVEGDSLFDIRFENGRMKIPKLRVYKDTERFFGNLMTYEQFMIGRPTYVTDYVLFMDSLINSRKDVEILRLCGIIKNWLGDDMVVATMFNSLRDLIIFSDDNCYLLECFNSSSKDNSTTSINDFDNAAAVGTGDAISEHSASVKKSSKDNSTTSINDFDNAAAVGTGDVISEHSASVKKSNLQNIQNINSRNEMQQNKLQTTSTTCRKLEEQVQEIQKCRTE